MYVAGGKLGTRNSPLASVTALDTPSASSLLIVTLTPGRTPPLASTTFPAIAPVVVRCASPIDGTSRHIPMSSAHRVPITSSLRQPVQSKRDAMPEAHHARPEGHAAVRRADDGQRDACAGRDRPANHERRVRTLQDAALVSGIDGIRSQRFTTVEPAFRSVAGGRVLGLGDRAAEDDRVPRPGRARSRLRTSPAEAAGPEWSRLPG